MLDQREADYEAYNASLLLTLGAIGARERLKRLLDAAVWTGAPDPRDEPALLAVLGLWSVLSRVEAHAGEVPPAAASGPGPVSAPLTGVLR